MNTNFSKTFSFKEIIRSMIFSLIGDDIISQNRFTNTDVNIVDCLKLDYTIIKIKFDPDSFDLAPPNKSSLSSYLRTIVDDIEVIAEDGSFFILYNDIFDRGMPMAETKFNAPISDFVLNNISGGNLSATIGSLGECVGYLTHRYLSYKTNFTEFFGGLFSPGELRLPPDWFLTSIDPINPVRYMAADSKATTIPLDEENIRRYSKYREKVVEGLNSAFRGLHQFLAKPLLDPALWPHMTATAFVTIIKRPTEGFQRQDTNHPRYGNITYFDFSRTFVVVAEPI